jgi:hypothetical protein
LESLRQGLPIEIGLVPLLDVTRFLAFRVVEENAKAQALFSLSVTIEGLPANRDRAILGWAIDSREAFLRYLRLLLADLGDPFAAQIAAKRAGTKSADGGDVPDDEPLLEDMVRALDSGSDRLLAVRRLVERLAELPEDERGDARLIPEEFLTLWSAFRTVLDEQARANV